MTGGVGLLVRERGRVSRVRAEQATLLGRARARGRARGPLGWAGLEGEKGSARVRFCFSFSFSKF
jgi:hypothetical protein